MAICLEHGVERREFWACGPSRLGPLEVVPLISGKHCAWSVPALAHT
jgi:hypothetical protein